MGVYLNPGNSGFVRITNSRYVDKTGLIALINEVIDTAENLICISRPRRFGKSYAAQMLCAYYDKTCQSDSLFSRYEISQHSDYRKYLNQYDVICLDIAGMMGETGKSNLVPYIKQCIINEIRKAYPDVRVEQGIAETLVNMTEYTGNKVIMVVDEWDALIRVSGDDPDILTDYLEFLHLLFKNTTVTSRVFAAVYMTGILPVKKDGSQSAISDFLEYTMIRPGRFGQYTGFTEEEVKTLCNDNEIDFPLMKQWYDGYEFKGVSPIYNPNSVMAVIRNHEFDSYWTETSAAEGLIRYITSGYHGLTKTIAELIAGIEVKVNTAGFANDLVTFKGKDDVLTLLIHLGYLAYHSETGTVQIPNEEIRLEFQKSIKETDHSETNKRLEESSQLFIDTLNGNCKAVAAQIEKVHMEETSPLHYNREDSLRSVIKLAYYTYRDHYLQWEELPAGEGFADIVYLPKHDSGWPALVVELKWNQSAQTAIEQILKKKYPEALKGYGSRILLVGISYDAKAPAGSKKHSCIIREIDPSKPGKSKLNSSSSRRNREELKMDILTILSSKGQMSMNELAADLGYARQTNTMREVLHEMLAAGEVKYLYPDKPNSKNQKICLIIRDGFESCAKSC